MSAAATPPRFEDALRELDQILRDLEEGAVSLEESLARYERGVHLLKQCYSQLQDAEHRVQLLIGTKADGSPELQPFETAVEKRKK
jgi:exodeoxyribonuclease VII small subunit